jgi:hypothetical protein
VPPVPPEAEIAASFETVLRERFELDAAALRESEDSWRFVVGGARLEAVVHYVDLRVVASLCAMDGEVDIDEVYRDLEAAEPLGLARIAESDNYLRVIVKLPFAAVTSASIEQAIRDCVALADAPQAHRLTGKWRRW